MIKGIREVKTKKQKPFWMNTLFVIATVVLVNYLITLCNRLGEKYAGIASIGVLILSIIMFILVIMKLLNSYIYTLKDDNLIFEKSVGKRIDIILELNLDEIILIKPYAELKDKYTENVAHTYKLVCDNEYDKFFFGEFERNDMRYRFIFKPSERLLRIINNKVNEKTVQL